MNNARFTYLAHFGFFLSGARRRMSNTPYSAPREKNQTTLKYVNREQMLGRRLEREG